MSAGEKYALAGFVIGAAIMTAGVFFGLVVPAVKKMPASAKAAEKADLRDALIDALQREIEAQRGVINSLQKLSDARGEVLERMEANSASRQRESVQAWAMLANALTESGREEMELSTQFADDYWLFVTPESDGKRTVRILKADAWTLNPQTGEPESAK